MPMKRLFLASLLLLSWMAAPAQAAIVVTERIAEFDTAQNDADYATTATWSFASTSVGICFVGSTSGTLANGTLTQTGYTWTQIGSRLDYNTIASPTKQVEVFRAIGTGATAAILTITYSTARSSIAINCFEVTGADTTGVNGANAIVQSKFTAQNATDPVTITMTGAPVATSTNLMFVGITGSTTFTADTGYTLGTFLGSGATPSVRYRAQHKAAANAQAATLDASGVEDSGGILLEIAVSGGAPPAATPGMLLLGAGGLW
jgi:hypothetical protein